MSKISTYEVAPLPKLSDKLIGTSVGGDIEDITYNFTLFELLQVFLPEIPANNLQGILDYGNTATQDINLFGTITTTNLSVTDTANLYITYLNEETHVVGTLFDSADSVGTAGQVLTSTEDGVAWYTLPPIFTPTLQQVLTEGNTSDIDIILDANIEALDVSTDTATINNQLSINGSLKDKNASTGSGNQVLSSTVTGVEWTDLPVYSAASPLLFDVATKTFSIQLANSTQGGYLSANDWVTFDGKQNAGPYITALTGEASANGPGSSSIILSNSAVINKVLTGLNVTGGSISSADSILSAFGKIQSQLNGVIGGVQYQGVWNAALNIPTLMSSTGSQGEYYIVNVEGNTDLNGITDWKVGDWAIFSSSSWGKVDNTESVSSVNGQVGAVSLTTDDIPEGSINDYFTESRARASLSFVAGSGAYNNLTGVISIPTNTNQLTNGASFITLASLSGLSPLIYNPLTGQFSIQQATALQNGYLSAADWSTFNNKQPAGDYVTLGSAQTITGSKTFQATTYFNTVGAPAIVAASDTNLAVNASSDSGTAIQAISGSGKAIKAESTSDTAIDAVSGSGVGLSVASLSNDIAKFYGASLALKASISQSGDITGNSFIKVGGLPTQFLKADGSLDSNAYLTSASLSGYVPYTGATTNLDLGIHNILANALILNPTPTTIPTSQGSMYFDQDEQTVAAVLNGSIMKIGEDSFFQIKNQSGATIPKGTAVRFDGVVGSSGRVLAVPFLADGTYPSLYFLGVTYESIPDGGDGKALILGKIRGINTNSYPAGTILYASTTVAGGYQTTPPLAPNNIISVAAVATQGVSNGTILVRPQLGSNINNDEGVRIIAPVTGDILQLQSGGLWENKSIASLALVPQSRILTINGVGYDLSADRAWSVGTITSLTGEATASGSGAVSVTLDNNAVTGKLLTGLNITGGTVVSTDSILVAFGKLQNELNGLIGGSVYQGTWNASTNTPTLTSSVGTKGHYYIVSVAGTTNLNGITEWSIGDWAIYDGTSWQKVDNTDSVVTVNGYAGNVSLVTGDILEGAGTLPGRPTQLYFTEARSRSSLSFAAGSGAYNSSTGLITIPTNTNQLTNGASFITLASISGVAPIQYNSGTGAISITQADASSDGYLNSTDWNTFNNKVSVATLAGYVPTSRTLTINGVGYDLSANRSWTIPTHDAVTIGTANGLSLSGQVLSLGLASSINAGALSASDWISFNAKQNALTNPVTGTGTVNYIPKFTGISTVGNSIMQDAGSYISVSGSVFTAGSANYFRAGSYMWMGGSGGDYGSVGYNIGYTTSTATYNYSVGDFASMLRFDSGGFNFLTAPNGSTGNAITFTPIVRFLNNGNVGIGNTNPQYKLSVDNGSIFLNHNNAAASYYLYLNKAEGRDGGILMQRNNSLDWQIANLNTTGDLQIYSYGTGNSVLQLSRGNGSATFRNNLFVNGGLISMDLNNTVTKITNYGYGGAIQLLRSDSTSTRWSRIGIVDSSLNWLGGLQINSDTSANFTGIVTASSFLSTPLTLAPYLDLTYNATAGLKIQYDASNAVSYIDNYYHNTVNTLPYGDIVFRTKSGGVNSLTSAVTIKGFNNNVLIAKVSDDGSKLQVNGGLSAVSYRVNNTDGNAIGYLLRQGSWVGGGSTASNLSIAAETGNGISFYVNGSSAGPPMFLNSVGNLGINTTSPNGILAIDQKASTGVGSTTIYLNHFFSGNKYIDFNWYGGNLGKISQVEGSRISINSFNGLLLNNEGGNVGVGVSNPGVKFVNSGGVNSSQPTLGSGIIGSQALLASNGLYGMYSGVSDNGDVWHQVQRRDGNTSVYNLILQPLGGSLAVGRTNPSSKFEVANGDIKLSDGYRIGWRYTEGDSNMYNWISNSYGSGIKYQSGSWTGGNVLAHDFQTHVSGSWQSRLSIYQNGVVSISDGNIGNLGGSRTLHIYGSDYTSASSVRLYQMWNGLAYGSNIVCAPDPSQGPASSLLIFQTSYYNGSIASAETRTALTITANLTATFASSVTATSFFESSDSRLKELIQNNYLPYGIDSVKPKLYRKNGKEEVGYFAQDFQSLLPSAVSINEEGMLSLSYTQVHTAKIAIIEDEVDILKKEVAELKVKLQKYKA